MFKSNINQTVPSQRGFNAGNFLPARLDARQAAKLLGFQEHDTPVLIGAKMMKPLGKPVANATKYFATCEIEALCADAKWLRDATQVIYDYWKGKNERRTGGAVNKQADSSEIALVE
jgi:hypothetical protein